jgi:hypothetical protein
MPIKELADGAAKDILAALGADAAKSAEVSKIVEKTLIAGMLEVRERCVDVVESCCSDDLAHQISKEIERKEKALVANLSSLR